MLVVLHGVEILGIEEIRVRVEGPEHAGDGPLVDGLVGAWAVREVLFHQIVYLGELLEAALEFVFGASGGGRDADKAGSEDPTEDRAEEDD
jgi:hypothetical protein